MRVASKPAFSIVVAAFLALAQDLFARITHIPISADEAVNIVILGSWIAYWAVPASAQDGGGVPVVTTAPPPPQAPAA